MPDVKKEEVVRQLLESCTTVARDIDNSLRTTLGCMETLVLNDMLRQVMRLYESEARYRHIALALCLQQGLPLVHGNRLAWEWVFANLVHKALQCTAARGLVTVSSTRQDGAVVVLITATGQGSASEEWPFVFARYGRAEHVRERQRTEGRLAGVKRMVAACGGRVQAEHSFGQETCFSVLLPVPPEPIVTH